MTEQSKTHEGQDGQQPGGPVPLKRRISQRARELLKHRVKIVEWPMHSTERGFYMTYAVKLGDTYFGGKDGRLILSETVGEARRQARKYREILSVCSAG